MQDETPVRRPPWMRWLPVGALALVAVVLLVLVVTRAVSGTSTASAGGTAATTGEATAATTAAARTTAATSLPTRPAPSTGIAPAKGTLPPPLTAAQQAAEQASLRAEAARLTRPLRLSSPAGWDQYLPAGKPYPGANTADDISTCPHLAAALSAALGKKMSYWTGTLPDGPGGCNWVPVPLSYDGPYDYAYILTVGYLDDGTTAQSLTFYENGPESCPRVDVPTVGPGAVLVRCASATDLTYALALRDARRPGGLWILQADARTDAAHSAADALDALVAGLRPIYG